MGAKAKAVEQRIAEHLKDTKRYLQVELNESVEEAADNVFKIMEGKRQKIADNYLSLKALAWVAMSSLPSSLVTRSRCPTLSLPSTASSTSTPSPALRSVPAGPWVSASTSWTRLRSP